MVHEPLTAAPDVVLMTFEVIRDDRFGKRQLVRSVKKAIPALATFYFLWRGWGAWNLDTSLGIAAFLAGIAIWAREDRQALRDFCCPRCGRHLLEPVARPRDHRDDGTVHFACDACEIEWDTGLRR